jgi:toxin-antitoxin system PIN domain toxin
MIVPDLNLLIYAVNEDSQHHGDARQWWESVVNGTVDVGLPWVVLLGFLRLTTSPRVFASPLAPAAAWELIDAWLDQPGCHPIGVGPRHYQILKTLTVEHGTAGNLTTDAHLAAICIDHNAVLYTADNDFARFTALKWRNPLK